MGIVGAVVGVALDPDQRSRGFGRGDLLGDRRERVLRLWADRRRVGVEQHVTLGHERRLAIAREHLDVGPQVLRPEPAGIDVDVRHVDRLDLDRGDPEFGDTLLPGSGVDAALRPRRARLRHSGRERLAHDAGAVLTVGSSPSTSIWQTCSVRTASTLVPETITAAIVCSPSSSPVGSSTVGTTLAGIVTSGIVAPVISTAPRQPPGARTR